ncbi:prepilin-type N-terminal cleavage/methylation domain-containing protein [Gemmatimonas aurantiaca]|uniref:type IV pilus modification PilV family protein n=1 Tax=Gemmatimonas aurantiaca TaxID=173480 RepID=UPI00301CD2CD
MNRKGFTLIETVIALSIFSAVVLSIGLGTTKLQRSVSDSGLRTRAFARADVQIGMARAWPTWGTLENLTGTPYNGTKDGLITSTVVQVDTLAKKRIKRLTVTVTSAVPGALAIPVKRTISIAAP